MQLLKNVYSSYEKTGKKQKILFTIICMMFFSLLFFPPGVVKADGSWISDESIYQSRSPVFDILQDMTDNGQNRENNWFESLIVSLLTSALALPLYGLLGLINGSFDKLVFGHVGGFVPLDTVNTYSFEMRSNNVYGIIGSMGYRALRVFCLIFMAAVFIYHLSQAAWKKGRESVTLAVKDAIKSAVIALLFLALLPNFIELMLYARDWLLYYIYKNMYSSVCGDGITISFFKLIFPSITVDTWTNSFVEIDYKGTSLINCAMFLGAAVLNFVLLLMYIGGALNITILYFMAPITIMQSMYDKNALKSWFTLFISCIFIPVGDALLLTVPLYLGQLSEGQLFGGGDIGRAKAVAQIGCCLMMMPARNMIKQAVGIQAGLGEGTGQMFGLMAARMAGNGIKNLTKKGMDAFKNSRNDIESAKHEQKLSELEKEEKSKAQAMAKGNVTSKVGEDITSGNTDKGMVANDGNEIVGKEKQSAFDREQELPKEIDSLDQDIVSLDNDIKKLNDDINDGNAGNLSKSELEEKKSLLQKKKAERSKKADAKAKAEKELDSIKSNMDTNLEKAKSEVGQWEEKAQQLAKALEADAMQNEEDKNSIEQVEKEVEEAQKEVDSYGDKLSQNEKRIKALEQRKANCSAEEATEIETEIKQLNAENDKIQAANVRLTNATNKRNAIADRMNNYRLKQNQLSEAIANRDTAQARVDNAERTLRDMYGMLNEQNVDCKEQIANANKVLATQNSASKQRVKKFKEANQELAVAQAEYDKAIQNNADQEKIEALSNNIEYYKKKADNCLMSGDQQYINAEKTVNDNMSKLTGNYKQMQQISTMMSEGRGNYGNMSPQTIKTAIHEIADRKTQLQKKLNCQQADLMMEKDDEQRERIINSITDTKNSIVDCDSQTAALNEQLKEMRGIGSSQAGGYDMPQSASNFSSANEYFQKRAAIEQRRANVNNFEQPDIAPYLTHEQKAEFYKKRAMMNSDKAVVGTVTSVLGGIAGASAGMFLGTPTAMLMAVNGAEFGMDAGQNVAEMTSNIIFRKQNEKAIQERVNRAVLYTGDSISTSQQNVAAKEVAVKNALNGIYNYGSYMVNGVRDTLINDIEVEFNKIGNDSGKSVEGIKEAQMQKIRYKVSKNFNECIKQNMRKDLNGQAIPYIDDAFLESAFVNEYLEEQSNLIYHQLKLRRKNQSA